MFDFLRKFCALDCILSLDSDLDNQYNTKKDTDALFLDTKKAYDNVSPRLVVRRLEELGVTGRAQAFMRDFPYNRSIQIYLKGVLSESRILTK